MEKHIEDGVVAVLVSRGFGAGWSTWNENGERLATGKEFVNLRLAGGAADEAESLYQEIFGKSEYCCTLGWDDIEVEHVALGEQFMIEEYDGSESLVIISNDQRVWCAQ